MENKYKELFQSLSSQNQFRPAVHIEYISIDDYASEFLSEILEKDIRAEGKREEFYDWSIVILNESITENELEKLYDLIGAVEYDREIQSQTNEYNEGITELCQRISNKLFSKIMPFEIETSLADDEGIWLFGNLTDSEVLNNIEQSVCENIGFETEDAEDNEKCCVCRNTRFIAHQACYHKVIVDSENNFITDIGIGEAGKPCGPYQCTKCDTEYEYLEEIEKQKEKINKEFNVPADKIEKELPNGMILITSQNNDPDYPGIQISLKRPGTDENNEKICFVEFNGAKSTGKELCICAYTSGQDEPTYYESYDVSEENKPENN